MSQRSLEAPSTTSQLTLRETAFALTLLCIGLAIVRMPIALLCPLVYFYFVTRWLKWRASLGIGRTLCISMIISVTISLCLLATALDYSKIYDAYSTDRVGLGLPPAIEIGVAIALLVAWFFGQLLPWAIIWYCSDLYRKSVNRTQESPEMHQL